MNDHQTIRYQRQGSIGTLTLARPAKRNAQNPLMWQELALLGAELLPDETLRCLLVTGEGLAFSAGIDLAEGMAGILADLAEGPLDEHSRAVGQAAAGTFN
jgi:enoyl-CoA hydratase/carnithine racemase